MTKKELEKLDIHKLSLIQVKWLDACHNGKEGQVWCDENEINETHGAIGMTTGYFVSYGTDGNAIRLCQSYFKLAIDTQANHFDIPIGCIEKIRVFTRPRIKEEKNDRSKNKKKST